MLFGQPPACTPPPSSKPSARATTGSPTAPPPGGRPGSYAGVPAELCGCEQVIEIGQMSGESNVVFCLEQRGIEPRPELVRAIFERAKRGNRLLDEAEIYAVVNQRATKTGS